MKRRMGAAALTAAVLSLTGCGAALTLPALPSAPVSPAISTTRAGSPSTSAPTPPAADGSMRQGMPDEVVDRLTLSRIFLEVAEVKGLHYRVSSRTIGVGNTSPAVLQRVVAATDDAIPRIEALTGQHVQHKYLVLTGDNDGTVRKWTDGTDVADADGVTMPYGKAAWIVIPTSHAFDDGTPIVDDPDYLQHLMDHEVFHADTLPLDFDDPAVPEWMVEGYAEWAADQEIPAGPEKQPPARLPSDSEVLDDTDEGYFRSAMFVQYLTDRFGTDKALAFYRAMLVATHEPLAAEFQRVTGASFPQTVADWRRQFPRQFRSYDPVWQWASD